MIWEKSTDPVTAPPFQTGEESAEDKKTDNGEE